MRRLEERWILTLPKVDAATRCMGWPTIGEELAQWRRDNLPDFAAELEREQSWAASITTNNKRGSDSGAGAAAAQKRARAAQERPLELSEQRAFLREWGIDAAFIDSLIRPRASIDDLLHEMVEHGGKRATSNSMARHDGCRRAGGDAAGEAAQFVGHVRNDGLRMRIAGVTDSAGWDYSAAPTDPDVPAGPARSNIYVDVARFPDHPPPLLF
eukprot:gene55647-557_t